MGKERRGGGRHPKFPPAKTKNESYKSLHQPTTDGRRSAARKKVKISSATVPPPSSSLPQPTPKRRAKGESNEPNKSFLLLLVSRSWEKDFGASPKRPMIPQPARSLRYTRGRKGAFTTLSPPMNTSNVYWRKAWLQGQFRLVTKCDTHLYPSFRHFFRASIKFRHFFPEEGTGFKRLR